MSQYTATASRTFTANSSILGVVELKDGAPVILRPFRREDESLVSDMFARCTRTTLHQRFHYSFKLTPEWVASRCQIDEDREIAIVAESDTRGTHQLAGLSRLVSSPDHELAEFAILIPDDWQGKGLGSIMTHHCLELARAWGVRRVTAVTTPDNLRMISVFKKMGFSFDYDWANGEIWVSKELSGPTGKSRDPQGKNAHLKRTA